jgi:hypothetical protein
MSAPSHLDRIPVARLMRPAPESQMPIWAIILQFCGWALSTLMLAFLALTVAPIVNGKHYMIDAVTVTEAGASAIIILAVSVACHMLIETFVKMLNHRPA